MATVPTPRSYSQIVGDMLDALLSKQGLPSVRVGSANLSIIESASQSDLRNSQDIFNLLNSNSLDRARGLALDRIGADEDVPRIGESPASGFVTISDTSFSKLQTKIFQGQPAPIIGSDKVYVADALGFPASGAIYIGRGTTNYEGPLTYTSKVNNTNYWTLNLASGSHTGKYHNLGEAITLAQGGNRLINAGTIVQTPQGNAGTAVQFATLYVATIPDGETSIESITVVARNPGTIGNSIAGAIYSFASSPFTGASVTNPLPYNNGLATEDDDTYRERIRAVRQSRSRGTPLALKTFTTGITALDENKRVISASVVTREGYPTTLYIDDGTGYEEKSSGIPLETIVDEALGGEQYFQLVNGRPVSKATTTTVLTAPFALEAAMLLSVRVGGTLSEHGFSADEFRAISSASAYEVAASINGNEDLLFGARPTTNGTQVALFSKADTNEDIEVAEPGTGFVDANSVLGFPLGRVDTLRLYKNDRLLSKDGQLATLTSNPQGLWGGTSSGETFVIRVDSVDVATSPINTYTITDADFVNAGTSYTTVSSTNSLASWATVLNFKVPGLTASVVGGTLTLTSNRGRSSVAKLEIQACTLVSKGFFSVGSSTGKDLDYTLDRNLGQIRLEDDTILHLDDKLTAGSLSTRAFLESSDLGSLTINSVTTSVAGQSGAELWFVVDGAAEIIKTGIGPSTSIVISLTATTTFDRVRLAAATSVFTNAAVGDWLIVNDANASVPNRGAWRIAAKTGLYVEIERPVAWASPETITLATGGITVVRTEAEVQRAFVVAAANYTASSLATLLNTQLLGISTNVYRTNRIRVRTNSFLTDGDIALVAANSEGLKLGLDVASAISNETSHLAALEAGNPEAGTPNFSVETLASVSSSTGYTLTSLGEQNENRFAVALKSLTDVNGTRYSNGGFYTPVEVHSGSVFTTRRPIIKDWLPGDRVYAASHYAISAEDEMTALLDDDTTSKRFVIPFFRRTKPTSGTFGITVTLNDADNANLSLAKAFGTGMDWRDFAVYMKARTKSHRIAGVDTNQTVLWRFKRFGLDGQLTRLQYTYPVAASTPVVASLSMLNSLYTEVFIRLPSGLARAGVSYSNNTTLGHQVTAGPTAGLYTYTYVLNLSISAAVREVRLDFTAHTGTWGIGTTVTGGTSTATGVIVSVTPSTSAAAGTMVITTVTGTFAAAETLTASGGNTATCSGAQYGVTKLTLALPPGITNHGLFVGASMYSALSGAANIAGFANGSHILYEIPSATQVAYLESNNTVASFPNPGTLSFDTAEAKFTGSTVVVGDIFNVGAGTNLPTAYKKSIKIQTLTGGYLSGQSTTVQTVSGVLLWQAINDTANLAWFPVTGATITSIASAVNAQGDSSPVTAVAVGDGLGDTSGSILFASYETTPNGLGGTDPWYYLSDGINYVRSHTTPANDTIDFTFTLKNAVNAELATNADFVNEDVRLVPLTADNIVDYLNTAGPGGLFASGEIAAANRGGRPQIATLTVGSAGSVQVQGGTVNGLTASVQGTAVQVAGTLSVVTVNASDTLGMSGGQWTRLQNVNPVTKARIDALTALTSIATNGTVTLDNTGTKAWDWANTATGTILGATWQIEKQGDFVAIQYVSGTSPDFTGVQEGDWVHVSSLPAGTVNVRNQGLYRVIRIDNIQKIFWIENSNVLPESVTASLAFLTYDSIVPGDLLTINTTLWGMDNLGTWTVADIDLSTYGGSDNRWVFFLDVTSRVPTAQGAVAALGTSVGLIQITEGTASRLYKRIQNIAVNPTDPGFSDVKFDTWPGSLKVSEAAGTIITVLDKLGFNTGIASGIDGYRHSTGLIAEANRVGYGDESDPSSYPGVIAAGANVNIEGPLVHRVQIALALRVRTGISTADIKDQVRSAVASVVNSTGVGDPVALSAIVTAAQSVNGVVSVTILSPTYSSGNDLISIQPFEKPLVLSLDDDVLISFVGE